ncbi:MAG: chemotaxis-specific protein-glutamate methyltransferase CheB [Bdellovibrionaceae bacterium]|nr:chemotaxis-specific protein-glutamate methyltransferase CheB [Pseudobdellovibrionaceae bacterium]MBX3033860.1 chemotaxis-specific protein-glutamate methyltransferase CheB [Pseudobdellovibrionaceae bacterium]
MPNQQVESPELVASVVAEVSRVISGMTGVQLGSRQSSMVENRLRSRIIRLGLNGFGEYEKYLKSHNEDETRALLSLLTTHHTYFFREFSQFEVLQQKLPQILSRIKSRGDRKFRIWSAASSRGQELYSLGMFFTTLLKAADPSIELELWGTDIDHESVDYAKNGVYRLEELRQVPAVYGNDHWIPGKGAVEGYGKVKDAIRRLCRFQTANLLDPKTYPSGVTFDVIFCRNVFIYFEEAQIRQCVNDLLGRLDPQGHLVIGISESLHGLKMSNIHTVAASVYTPAAAVAEGKAPAAKSAAPAKSEPLRMLCVDDSPTIHQILQKIFVAEKGFRIAGTAKNGQEAVELLKKQEFDAITLDLEMPVMTGLEFLAATSGMKRPPVMILSSIDRDRPDLGREALRRGAADYMEKPSLQNLAQAADQIRTKLKSLVAVKGVVPAHPQGPAKPAFSESPAAKPASAPTPGPAVKPAGARTGPSAAKKGPKKVLIVDDSAVIRQLLKKILSQDPELQVVAEAERPSQVEALIRQHKPDVMTLDINMPEMDGVTLLKKIMPTHRLPTVMISSISRDEGPAVLEALASGAMDYIQKPTQAEISSVGAEIRDRVKAAASSVVRARLRGRKATTTAKAVEGTLIVLGASTGGTEALRVVLESFPAEIPPTLIVQHIPAFFSAAFAERLNQICPFEVREAKDGDEVRKNLVLIAPGGKQMGFVRGSGGSVRVKVTDDPPVNRHAPSVDYLFDTVAQEKIGHVVAALLTGMGADGARGLKTLRDRGARTIAQDEQTSVVFGMPREAIERGAAEAVLPLEQIGEEIIRLSTVKPAAGRKAS